MQIIKRFHPLNWALVAIFAAATGFAQESATSSLPIDEWVTGPEQHFPGWDVRVSPPVLTFELRWAVSIQARGDVNKSGLAGHQLQTFVKVGNSTQWFPGMRQSSMDKIPKSVDLNVTENFYAKPGDYRIGFVLYDPVAKTHGVWHESVHVPEAQNMLDYPEAAQIQFIDAEKPFRRHSPPASTSVGNGAPLELDIVLNLTERSELEIEKTPEQKAVRVREPRSYEEISLPIVTGPTPDWFLGRSRQDLVTESMLSITSSLTALKFNGCVRVSAIDAVKGKVLLDREKKFDPEAVFMELRNTRDTNQVDVRALNARKNSATFLGQFLKSTIADSHGCGQQARADRAVVVISDQLSFPADSTVLPVAPDPREGVPMRVIFLRMDVPEFEGFYTLPRPGQGAPRFIPVASSHRDQVNHLLKELNARRFDLGQPKDFQRALPQLIDELRKASDRKS